MRHVLKLKPKFFECIKKGSKIIELRLLDEKRQKIKLGDEIEFLKEPELKENVITKVSGLLIYPSFEDILSDYPISYFSDDNTTKEDLLESLNTFYSKEQQEKFGVVGIRIKLT